MEMIRKIFHFIHRIEGYLQISESGYVEHLIAGSLIGGLITHLTFEKTNHKLKSIIFGISVAFLIGLAKEYIDPIFGGWKDKFDLIYTILGSVFGTILFFINNYIQQKRKNYLEPH